MRKFRVPRALVAVVFAGGAVLWGSAAALPSINRHAYVPPAPTLPDGVAPCEPGWQVRALHAFPETVSSLASWQDPQREGQADLYVGTSGVGCIYKLSSVSQFWPNDFAVAYGLGDRVHHATCEVSELAIRDLDHDGRPELLAATSQINPRGRPRLYVWSLEPTPLLRGLARPAIQSSWSHSLCFLPGPDGDRVLSTYCGFGEVVEFRLGPGDADAGFRTDGLAWKQVGQLPASGESVHGADADNDGRVDLCLAAGFLEQGAAIHIGPAPAPGEPARPRHVLDEDKRFANVRFLVAPTGEGGASELFAWWSSGLNDGDCELIRYRLGRDGVRSRTVIARGSSSALWPADKQMALADLHGDGRPQVWFAAGAGNLWRYDPARPDPVTRVLHAPGGIGPILDASTPHDGPALLLAVDRTVVRLQRAAAPGARALRAAKRTG